MNEYEKKYEVVKKLQKDYTFERYAYSISAIVGFIALLPCCYLVLREKNFDVEVLGTMFGSTGIIGITGYRILRMWDVSMNAIFGK